MRIPWSHAVRPRVGSSASNNCSIVSRPTRKTVSASARPKLSFNDAFTILLAPVLGTALIADTTWKDHKKEDWSKKLAQVEDEIAAIREREITLWNNLQARSIRYGTVHHKRMYSTAARAYVEDPDFEPEMPEDDIAQSDVPARHQPARRPKVSDAKLAGWKRYENLVASKLAIEMILHMRSGKSVLNRLPVDIVLDQNIYPESLDGLVRQLIQINANLEKFAATRSSEAVPQPLIDSEERHELHQRISALSHSCRRGQIPVRDLVHGYAQAIAELHTAPSIATYNVMLEALSAQDSNSLAYSVMAAMKNSKQHLTNRAIWAMLWQYGKYKDSGRLDEFLWLLTKQDSVLRLRGRWQMIYVNGVRIPVPLNRDPHLISILVRAALQCGMLHKAEAWATVIFQEGQKCKRFAHIFGSMIQYCAEHGDWKAGRRWLEKTIQWASLLGKEAPQAFNRMIFRILDLCVVCDQPAEYDRILRATARCGIEIHTVDKERPAHFSGRALSIRDDWQSRLRHESRPADISDGNTDEKIRYFQDILACEDSSIKPFIGVMDAAELISLSTSRTDGEMTSDHEHQCLSPGEIMAGTPNLETTSTNKNIRQLRRSLKELLKQSGQQRARIEGLIAELAASRTELAQLKQAPIGQVSSTKAIENNKNQDSARRQIPKPSTHLTHLHLIADYQKLSQDFGQAQHDIERITAENKQLHFQLQQASATQGGHHTPKLPMSDSKSGHPAQKVIGRMVGTSTFVADPPVNKTGLNTLHAKERPKPPSDGMHTSSKTRCTESYFQQPVPSYTASNVGMNTNGPAIHKPLTMTVG